MKVSEVLFLSSHCHFTFSYYEKFKFVFKILTIKSIIKEIKFLSSWLNTKTLFLYLIRHFFISIKFFNIVLYVHHYRIILIEASHNMSLFIKLLFEFAPRNLLKVSFQSSQMVLINNILSDLVFLLYLLLTHVVKAVLTYIHVKLFLILLYEHFSEGGFHSFIFLEWKVDLVKDTSWLLTLIPWCGVKILLHLHLAFLIRKAFHMVSSEFLSLALQSNIFRIKLVQVNSVPL